MKRVVNIEDFSDVKRLNSNDLARIACNDCSDCSECCRTVGDTIILDPYDIYQLEKGLKMNFAELLSGGRIVLRVVDGVIQPNLSIRDNGEGCSFLSEQGRCTIHAFRPGFCRLFPLGRIYDENGAFQYFVQENECPHPNKTKVKIRQWLGIERLDEYENYIRDFHAVMKSLQTEMAKAPDREKELNMLFLQKYYLFPYDTDKDFYEQYAGLK
ncbi:MAG: YkgJ family cysteine cluster protein [Lachnospiraceae bacterium]|nr:YkgJ family cysteine cluster protein [Lachnospiraceae bacterium]